MRYLFRFALVAIALAAVVMTAGARQSPDARFQPPSGYRLVESREIAGKETFYITPTETVELEGRGVKATYRFTDAAAAPSPLATLRSFRDRLVAQGGVRLVAWSDDEAGELAGVVHGSAPLWITVGIDKSGAGLDLTILEEPAAGRTEFRVPSELVPGIWTRIVRSEPALAEANRVAVTPLATRVFTQLRAVPSLAPVMAVNCWVTLERAAREGVPAGPTKASAIRFKMQPLIKTCADCPIAKDGDYFTAVNVRVNDLAYAFEPLYMADDLGRPLFAIPPGHSPSSQILVVGDATLVLRPHRPPFWRTVSREVFLRAKIRQRQSQTARMSAHLAKTERRFQESLKQFDLTDSVLAGELRQGLVAWTMAPDPQSAYWKDELASLSADEKARPARAEDGSDVVSLNAAYFDPTLAPEVPQLIVLYFARPREFSLEDLIDRVRTELTPARLAALLR